MSVGKFQFSILNSQKRRRQGGQTMVDLIVALSLLSLSVTSAASVATTSTRVNTEAGRRSVATGLADRELEAVRAYRDNAVRAGKAWNTVWVDSQGNAPQPGTCLQFFMIRSPVPSGNTWVMNGLSSPPNPEAYQSSNAPDVANISSYQGFTRIDSVCPVTDAIPGSSQKVDNTIMVVVDVLWQEASGPQRKVELRSILTDRASS